MSESVPAADDALVDVSVTRKLLDEPLAVQQVDLPDFCFGDNCEQEKQTTL